MNDAHPATSIDPELAAATFCAWLLGEGPMWDPFIRDNRPEMQCPVQNLEYTMDGVLDRILHESGERIDELDPRSERGRRELMRWCRYRAEHATRTLSGLSVAPEGIVAHRLVATTPDALRPDLGIFWTHSIEETVDAYAMWAEGGRDAPTLCIEAIIPLEAIDWQVSCMALMDWMLGDTEQELRLRPGHPVEVKSCTWWHDDSPVQLPDAAWRT